MGWVRLRSWARALRRVLARGLGRAALALGLLSAHGMARSARAVPAGRRPPAWRADEDFAAIVAPLADSMGWRLRTRRLCAGDVVGRRVRPAAALASVAAGGAAAASVLAVTLADAYATPWQLALRPFM